MHLLTCLRCTEPFIGQFSLHTRPVFETIREMREAGRSEQRRVGVETVPACPALCDDCRTAEGVIAFRTDWEE